MATRLQQPRAVRAINTAGGLASPLLTRSMESGDGVHHPVALTGRTSGNLAVRAVKADGVLDLQFTRIPLTDLERT